MEGVWLDNQQSTNVCFVLFVCLFVVVVCLFVCCLFVCLFVCIKPEKPYSAYFFMEGSKTPGSDRTRTQALLRA